MAKKPVVKKQKKDNSKRNATLAFCITAVAYANIFGLQNVSSFIICGLLSLLTSTIVKIATTPMKGIEAPTDSTGIIPENVEDQFAHDIIANGLKMMDQLVSERNLIGEPIFTRRINDFISVYREMLSIVNRDYSKAPELRKMNSYYIPTIIKLLRSYRDAKAQGTSFTELAPTRDKLLKTLDQLVEAARNVRQELVRAKLETMDITREVLDDMLRADGYIEDDETADLRTSATEASQQMSQAEQMSSAPVQPVKAAPVRKAPAVKPSAKPAVRPAMVQPATQPAHQSAVRPLVVQPLEPAVSMDAPAPAPEATPAPQLQTSMPTASAQQLNQGAPVLHVPGLLPEDDEPRNEAEKPMLL